VSPSHSHRPARTRILRLAELEDTVRLTIRALVVVSIAACLAGVALVGCDSGKSNASPATSGPPPALTPAGTARLAVIRPDGSGLRLLGPASNFAAAPAPSWSPDGKQIAFSFQHCPNCAPRVSIVFQDGRLRAGAPDPVGGDPSWSPNGDLIAYTHKEVIERELEVVEVALGTVSELDTAENATHPDWFPDGKAIVFAAEVDERLQLFRSNADGTGQRQLTTSGFYDDPTVSSDGRRIAAACLGKGEAWGLCMVGPHGIREILRRDGNSRSPSFSPDGRRLVFSSDRGSRAGARALHVLDLKTGKINVLTGRDVDSGEPAWSPDGHTIVFARRALVETAGG
jgi:TolB protein